VKRLAAPLRSFLCLRHGATDWNRQGLFQGRSDNALNGDGVAQAHAAARRLQRVPLDHIVTSPLVRAVKTAEIIASVASTPVSIDDGIIECDFGSLEGKSIRGAMAERGITAMEDLVSILPPDGEAWANVAARALHCVSKWHDRFPQANMLFVCHDGVMQSLAEPLCSRWFDNRHGTPFRFTRTDNGWELEEVG
jgi:broad specificity phosphatase PhoE